MSAPVAPETHSSDAVGVFRAFDHLFTEENEAVSILLERRTDEPLKQAVRGYVGTTADSIFTRTSEPIAILFRQVATPNHEALRFLDKAKRLGLYPLIIEYGGDKFVSAGNPYKRALGKLPIFQHTGSDGRDMVKYKTVIDFNAFVGRAMSEVCCISGLTLMDFHHELFEKLIERKSVEYCLDATETFHAWGSQSKLYYPFFFSLFIRDCILFENYEITSHLTPFMHDVVLPAFEAVETTFGKRPLITHLVPPQEEQRLYWNAYPKHIEQFLL